MFSFFKRPEKRNIGIENKLVTSGIFYPRNLTFNLNDYVWRIINIYFNKISILDLFLTVDVFPQLANNPNEPLVNLQWFEGYL
ncbi:hypothetical protein C6X94_03355 [Bacillus safensis]|nr:hypothetical protein C6X94_03355 [Bacillus safensis]